MTQAWNQHEPTAEQVEQTKRVERALWNELNLMAREGVPVAILLTGLGIVTADLITCQKGPEAVAPWFKAQGAMIEQLQRPN